MFRWAEFNHLCHEVTEDVGQICSILLLCRVRGASLSFFSWGLLMSPELGNWKCQGAPTHTHSFSCITDHTHQLKSSERGNPKQRAHNWLTSPFTMFYLFVRTQQASLVHTRELVGHHRKTWNLGNSAPQAARQYSFPTSGKLIQKSC